MKVGRLATFLLSLDTSTVFVLKGGVNGLATLFFISNDGGGQGICAVWDDTCPTKRLFSSVADLQGIDVLSSSTSKGLKKTKQKNDLELKIT